MKLKNLSVDMMIAVLLCWIPIICTAFKTCYGM